jgi:hypothetical protein
MMHIMTVRRGPEGEPVELTPEQVFSITFDIDMAARQTFGWPYEEGMAEYYTKAGTTPDGATLDFIINAAFSAELQLFVPDIAELRHVGRIDKDNDREHLARLGFMVSPPAYHLVEETRYEVHMGGGKLKRVINYGWYNSKQDSWALYTRPPKPQAQIKGFAPTKLNAELVDSVTQEDRVLIYEMLGMFGFVES